MANETMIELPTSIGKYEIRHLLGRGGFASVYKATDSTLNRDVAIKVLHANWAQDRRIVQRFRREATSIAVLRHPNIVTVYEIDQLPDGRPYMVQECLPGVSLADYLREQRSLSTSQILSILNQVSAALDYAHGQDIVHRDVKPGNIMAHQCPDGRLDCVLTDFGLAKILEERVGYTSEPLGTAAYMAPEQIAPEQFGEIGPATDLYALGVMAYALFTGKEPFEGTTATVMVSHLQQEPVDPSTFCPTVSPETGAVLLKALSKEPSDRYSTAADMIAALQLSTLVTAASLPSFETAAPPSLVSDRPDQHLIPVMQHIPGGRCWIGSASADPEASENEKPRHQRDLAAFSIGRYPITNDQYALFVRESGHPPPPHWPDGQIPPGKERHPVTLVSHEDAEAYCRWLSATTAAHFRLPTEQEWEKAARGEYPDTRRYPWGERWIDRGCNTSEEKHHATTPVDAYRDHNCSPFGVIDMVGNVWEWTHSLYSRYPGSTRYSTSYGTTYVVRGGSWRNGPLDARIATRGRYKPAVRRDYLGFRIVQESVAEC